jgi:hypothetical protein
MSIRDRLEGLTPEETRRVLDELTPDEWWQYIFEMLGDGTKEGFRRASEAAERNAKAFQDALPRLAKQYPNKWVAYHEEELKAVADSHDDLLRQLDEQGIPRGDPQIRFLEHPQRVWAL